MYKSCLLKSINEHKREREEGGKLSIFNIRNHDVAYIRIR